MPLLEIVAYSYASALAAQLGGADRVELCENTAEGGTTPSLGTLEAVRELPGIKAHVMIRPRGPGRDAETGMVGAAKSASYGAEAHQVRGFEA